MSNSGGGVWDNSVWARYISPMLQQLGQNVGTPNASVPYDRQVRWDPQAGGYVKVQNQFGQPVRSADINLLPSPQLPQGAPYQPPSAPMPGSGGMGFGGQMGRLGGQLGGGNGIQHMLQRLAQSQQSPMPAKPRPPQMPPATGAFAGNAQGSVVGDMGPTPQMGGYVPTGGDLNELPQEALGGARALPNTFGSMYGQALPQQRNALSALLAAITRRG